MRKLAFKVELEDFNDKKYVGVYEIRELTAKEMLNFSRNFMAKHNIKSEPIEVNNEAWNYEFIALCATKDGKKLTVKFIENSPTKLYQALLIGVSKLNALGKDEQGFLLEPL